MNNVDYYPKMVSHYNNNIVVFDFENMVVWDSGSIMAVMKEGPDGSLWYSYVSDDDSSISRSGNRWHELNPKGNPIKAYNEYILEKELLGE